MAFIGDVTLSWSSPILPKLYHGNKENPLGRPITTDEEQWIGSFIYIGAMIGVIPFGVLADKIGRKPILLILAIPHIIAFIMFAFAKNIALYYIGRVIGGIALSSIYIVLPMYIAEISENNYRGQLLVTYSTFASFGDLFPYIIGPYISILWFNIILAIFPIIFVISFLFIGVESPVYYVKNNDKESAKLCLCKLRAQNKEKVIIELEEIENEIDSTSDFNFYETIKMRHVIKGFIICICLSSFQQLSGIGAILSYTQTIFIESGSSVSSDISSIIVGFVLFLGSFFGPVLVERIGRKFLLICSTLGMIISQFCLGLYFYLQDHTDLDLSILSWLPILCLVAFTLTFNAGFGPLPFTISSEVLPSNVKFIITSFTGFTGWLSSFLVTRFFIDLNNSLGRGETFWLFTGICICALCFVIFYVPETKGKSFQEIQQLLAK